MYDNICKLLFSSTGLTRSLLEPDSSGWFLHSEISLKDFLSLSFYGSGSPTFPPPSMTPLKKTPLPSSPFFSRLQSEANCPNKSILKQSKQNWGPSQKYHQEAALHMLFWALPLFPPFLCSLPICLRRHLSAAEPSEDQWPAPASSSQETVRRNLCHIDAITHKTDRFSAGRKSVPFCFICFEPLRPERLLLFFFFYGSYRLIRRSKWFIPVALMLFNKVSPQLDVNS